MGPSDNRPDAVIVGAGIAGSALAVSLARSGHSVTLLEKSAVHVDRVRGEFIVPWGVAEAKALGILDLLEGAGGNYTVRSIPYGEDFPPEVARKYTVPMDQMVPGIQGSAASRCAASGSAQGCSRPFAWNSPTKRGGAGERDASGWRPIRN